MEKSGDIDLIPASITDIDAIRKLAKAIWVPYFTEVLPGRNIPALFEGMYGVEHLEELLKNDRYTFYFCQRRDDTIGYMAICRDSEVSVQLDKIYIHPSFRGAGYGMQLVKWCVEQARLSGAHSIWLRVNRDNTQAIALYKKLSFAITGEKNIPGPDNEVYNDYIMTRELKAAK